jgi:hypothetical protein
MLPFFENGNREVLRNAGFSLVSREHLLALIAAKISSVMQFNIL